MANYHTSRLQIHKLFDDPPPFPVIYEDDSDDDNTNSNDDDEDYDDTAPIEIMSVVLGAKGEFDIFAHRD